jgi:hypothetical protein
MPSPSVSEHDTLDNDNDNDVEEGDGPGGRYGKSSPFDSKRQMDVDGDLGSVGSMLGFGNTAWSQSQGQSQSQSQGQTQSGLGLAGRTPISFDFGSVTSAISASTPASAGSSLEGDISHEKIISREDESGNGMSSARASVGLDAEIEAGQPPAYGDEAIGQDRVEGHKEKAE